jgi:hypothetical protein
MRRLSLIPALVALSVASCSSLKENNAPPSGLQCQTVVNGGGSPDSLTAALTNAQPGSCVLLVTQTYSGNFKVPQGVTIASAEGSRAIITGSDPNSAAIELVGGEGSGVYGLDVNGSAQVGIAVRNGAALIQNVNVSGAKSAGIAAICAAPTTCHDGSHVLELDNVNITSNDSGLWAKGEDVKMSTGTVSQNSGDSLTAGNGIIAFGGANVALNGTTVANNDQVGILVDGTTASDGTGGGTTGDFESVTVSQNGARGIWAQGLTGTLDAPALKIGGTSLISGNKIVGLGATGSHGIIFVGGKIENTVAAPFSTTLGEQAQVGDGFGAFNSSGDLKLDTVEVSNCARAAGVLDTATGVIIFVGGSVNPGASGLKIVVQNSSADAPSNLQIAPDVTSTTSSPLYVSAPQIQTGSLIQASP